MVTVIIITVATLFIICSFINNHIDNKRQIHINEMRILYDKMSLFVLENDLQKDAKYTKFLAPLKNYIINPGFIDIQIMMATIIQGFIEHPEFSLEKIKEYTKNVNKGMPRELLNYKDNFNKHLSNAMKLSFFKADFLFFLFFGLIKVIFISFWKRSTMMLKMFWDLIINVTQYEQYAGYNFSNKFKLG